MSKEPLNLETPSIAIRQSIEDLTDCEGDARYDVYMGEWHYCEGPGWAFCVCLAGSVMAKRMRASTDANLVPSDFGTQKAMLLALNNFRCGNVDKAFSVLGLPLPVDVSNRFIPDYEDDSIDFKKAMLALADELEATGH